MHAVLAEPHVDVEEVVLLRPEEASEGLSHDARGVLAGGLRRAGSVELVRLATPGLDRLLEGSEGTGCLRRIREAEPDRHRLAGTNLEAVVSGGLGAGFRRVDGVAFPVHDERVEGVLDVRARVGRVEEPLGIGVVLGEQQRRRTIAVEPSIAKFRVRRRHDARAARSFRRRQVRFRRARPPVPRVAEPQRGQQMNRRGLRPPVRDGDPDEAFLRRRLGILDEDVEVAIVVEDAAVDRARTRSPCACGAHSSSRGRRTGRRPGGTCTATSCTSGSAWNRDRSSTPSRPRRGSPRHCSSRRAAPSGSGPSRSRAPRRNTVAASGRRSLRARPLPSGTRATARDRGGSTPTHRRPGCSPRAPSPTAARSGRGPTSSRARSTRARPPIASARRICRAPSVRRQACADDASPDSSGLPTRRRA